ncbi:MAG: hypothetical protein ACRD5G_03575 [Candidatus Acidiferrales bacterium]
MLSQALPAPEPPTRTDPRVRMPAPAGNSGNRNNAAPGARRCRCPSWWWY